MANNGRHSNGSQFYITLRKAPQLDARHVVVGQLVEGMEVLRAMQLVPSDPTTNVPKVEIVITGKARTTESATGGLSCLHRSSV